MDEKVVRLQDASEERTPNELTIQRAEELLQLAKDGELRGFIIVGETGDGSLFEGGAEIYDLPLINTGLDMAKARVLDAIIDGSVT